MIDWLTLSLPYAAMSDGLRDAVLNLGDRIMRYSPGDGRLVWETSAWDSVRSDSHQVVIRSGTDALHLQGSPARAMGDGDAVFGVAGAGAADGARAMIRHVSRSLGLILPSDLCLWRCTRMDCTVHLLLDDLAAVRVALGLLRGVEGGRYRVSAQAGDTVYWSHRSRLRAGKAYAKGPHLSYLMKRPDHSGRAYTADEITAANRLLRLELRLGSQYWRERAERPWYEWTAVNVEDEAWDYFGRMLEGREMVSTVDIERNLRALVVDGVPLTDGRVRAALGCWALIQSYGWESAKSMTTKSTWYRNIQYLRLSGLTDADISAGRIVELRVVRRRLSDAARVQSWADVLAA